jgi:peptide chain release factor 2
VIIALENAKYELQNFRENLKELGSALRIDELKIEVEELEKTTFDPDFWSNQENSTKVLQKIKQMKSKIENYDALEAKLEDTITLTEMAIEENDESLVEEILAEQKAIIAEEEKQRIEVLLSGEYDKNNAIISFHPGAGGTEAQDWASMLFRMYSMYCEKNGFVLKVLDSIDGDEAGLKSITCLSDSDLDGCNMIKSHFQSTGIRIF